MGYGKGETWHQNEVYFSVVRGTEMHPAYLPHSLPDPASLILKWNWERVQPEEQDQDDDDDEEYPSKPKGAMPAPKYIKYKIKSNQYIRY